MATRNDAAKRGLGQVTHAPDLGAEPRILMSLRVSRDSGRSWSRTTQVREGDPFVILSDPGRYPPCECPLCVGPSVSARVLRPPVAEPGTA